jgi:hypothetical protein
MANPTEYTFDSVRGDTQEFDITLWNYRYALSLCGIWVTMKTDLSGPDDATLQVTLLGGGVTITYDGQLTTQAQALIGAESIVLTAPLAISLPKGTVLGFAAGTATLQQEANAGESALVVEPLKHAIPAGDQARVGLLRATFPAAATAGFAADTTLNGDVQLKYPNGHIHTAARIKTTVYLDATKAT